MLAKQAAAGFRGRCASAARVVRYDGNLLVNPHVWGQPASANPLPHLKRAGATGWFDNYVQSFEAVWAAARPRTPDQEGTVAHGQA
ncbi:hypothetical protein [Streptomyces noursei]|uniref:hypothetical protein n=1 Tax=Streptomyces noursei TaxID=1971 RepID=UPI0026A261B5